MSSTHASSHPSDTAMAARPRSPAAWIGCILAISWTLLAWPAAARSIAEYTWIRLQSKHFTVLSSAGERDSRRMTLALERLRTILQREFPELRVDTVQSTQIVVFENQGSLAQFLDPSLDPRHTGGLFQPAVGENWIIINGDPETDPSGVLYHEFVHQVLWTNAPVIPAWVTEGMAVYYSTYFEHSGTALIGRPQMDWLDLLRSEDASSLLARQKDNKRPPSFWVRQLMPMEELVAIRQPWEEFRDQHDRPGQMSLFYAQSWALVHHFISGRPDGVKQLWSYLEALGRGQDPREAFRGAFQGDYEDLHTALRNYLATAELGPRKIATAELPIESELQVSTVTLDDAFCTLGRLMVLYGPAKAAKCRWLFREALRQNPKSARAHAGLAELLLMEAQPEKAVLLFDKALKLDPDDPLIHLRKGYALLVMTKDMPPGVDYGLQVENARKLLRRSLELQPDLIEAELLWASTFMVERNPPDEAVTALEKAMLLMPARTDIPFWLMSVCARRGEHERAQRIFDESLAKRCPPDQLANAHEILLRGQMRESHLLLDQGRSSEALESLDKLLDRTVDPKGREIVQKQIEAVREIERFNEAMGFVMKKDYDRAAKLLEDLLRTAKDPDVRQHAEKELDSLRSRRKKAASP